MKPVKKMSFMLLAAAMATIITVRLAPEEYHRMSSDNPLVRSILQRLEDRNSVLPEERLYLHLDKPFYEPGDDIWFAAYLRNGINLAPAAISDIVHVELINPRGGV